MLATQLWWKRTCRQSRATTVHNYAGNSAGVVDAAAAKTMRQLKVKINRYCATDKALQLHTWFPSERVCFGHFENSSSPNQKSECTAPVILDRVSTVT